jgi:hemerythrin
MDVLHFLRSHHEKIRDQFEQIDITAPISRISSVLGEAVKAVEIHFNLEKDYLYPEISGAFHGVEALVAAGLANASVAEKKIKTIGKLLSQGESQSDSLEKSFFDLKSVAYNHFEQEERILLPKMREFVRTEDREDLGQVLMDVQEELWSSRLEAPSAASSDRLRA